MPAPPAAPLREVKRLVRLAHEHLGLGMVCVGEFVGGRQVYRAVAGDAASFSIEVGAGVPLEVTYCALMVEGEIPQVIRDSAQNDRVMQLPGTVGSRIGAYVGVPLRLRNGELYGTLCALSHDPELDLNPRDANFLQLVGQFMLDGLSAHRRLSRQAELLRRVIETRAITTALQPIVDLVSGRCTSVEALSRFPSRLGRPDVVFADAHQSGVGAELEWLAIERAIELLPLLAPGQRLAINVSPDVAFRLVSRISEESPLHRLVLEITEHAAVSDYRGIREQLRPLRERGLRLAIDDAGAGYASLRHIIEMRPDVIKIDRSLIAGIDSDFGRRSALTTFVLLALDIGAIVVAEGVETAAELSTVASLGVDAVQGYLLARPTSDVCDIQRWACGANLLDAIGSDTPPAD